MPFIYVGKMSSSCEEDMNDEEVWELINKTILRRKRTIRTRPNHFHIFDDVDFYARFRMSKKSAYSVLELIGPNIKNPKTW